MEWFHPLGQWVKCNTDGATKGSYGQASLGGIFRGSSWDFLGCFSLYIGNYHAFHAEFIATMISIEEA
ncbi:hypothetical protein Lal_00026323 [Lupinus albus]|nr:hypothetical protein Lal_00026323 [Lupinus albus]